MDNTDNKQMVDTFFVVSLDYETSGFDIIGFNGVEVSEAISKFIEADKSATEQGKLTIKKCTATEEVSRDLCQDEFIQMYFDNIEWVVDNITEVEKITIDL